MSGVTQRDRTTTATRATAEVFGPLWERYDDRLFEESVGLFARRFEANGFDLGWFAGKRALDVGCGGGRYTIAMARLGANAIGCDIAPRGLADAVDVHAVLKAKWKPARHDRRSRDAVFPPVDFPVLQCRGDAVVIYGAIEIVLDVVFARP